MALAIDGSSPTPISGNAATGMTTASFNPPANSLIVVLASADDGTTPCTANISDNQSHTYTRYARSNSNGTSEVWGFYTSSALTGLTITAQFTNGWNSANTGILSVLVFTGASSTQPGATNTTNAHSLALTPNTTGSYIVGSYTSAHTSVNASPLDSNTTIVKTVNGGGGGYTITGFRSTSTTSSFASTSYGISNAGQTLEDIVAVEILSSDFRESTPVAASAQYWSNINPYSTSLTVPVGSMAVILSAEGSQDAGNAIAVSDGGSHTWKRLNTYDPVGTGYALDYWYNNTGSSVTTTVTVTWTNGGGNNYVCLVDPMIINNCANPAAAPPRIAATITNASTAQASATPSVSGSLLCLHYLQLNPSADVSSLVAGSAVDSSPASTIYLSGGPSSLGTIHQTAVNAQTASPVTVGATAPTTAQSYGILVEYFPLGTITNSAVTAWLV